MLNSSLIFLNSYNKNRVWSILSFFLWIIYMLVNQTSMGVLFSIVNILIFAIVAISIHCIKNKKANMVLSVFSVIFWSILIDIATYFMYPAFTGNISIVQYVFNGILFNYRYIFLNLCILAVVELVTVIFEKLKNTIVNREKIVDSNIVREGRS